MLHRTLLTCIPTVCSAWPCVHVHVHACMHVHVCSESHSCGLSSPLPTPLTPGGSPVHAERISTSMLSRHHPKTGSPQLCLPYPADGCRVNVRPWETWTLPRWTPACIGLLKPFANAKSCSATVLKKWPQLATTPCFRGGAALQCCCSLSPVPIHISHCCYAFHAAAQGHGFGVHL